MSEEESRHYLVVALPSLGHLIPALALADCIAGCGHNSTLAVCQYVLNTARTTGILTEAIESRVRIIALDDGIPPGTPDKQAFEMYFEKGPDMQAFFTTLSVKYSAVIVDTFVAAPASKWLPSDTPLYIFNSFSLGTLWKYLLVTPETPADLEIKHGTSFIIMEGPLSPVSPVFKRRALQFLDSLPRMHGILVNSIGEAEEIAITAFKNDPRSAHLDIFCIGPLLSVAENFRKQTSDMVLRWLNTKLPNSVIYVSFGSMGWFEESRLVELAKALDHLRRPFIFALPVEEHHESFLQGLDGMKSDCLVMKWVPQKLVLAHSAVQVFVTHCGWNSTLEGLFYGRPFVAWPAFGDQLENALWIERIGVGKSLVNQESREGATARDAVKASDIVDLVKEVTEWPVTTTARAWRKKMRTAVEDGGSSPSELERFFETSDQHR